MGFQSIVATMFKSFLLVIVLVSCSHGPGIQYNDPAEIRQDELKRSLLSGAWRSERGILILRPSGEYQWQNQSGIWGIRQDDYFTLQQEFYRNHRILRLDSLNFEYQDVKSGEKFKFVREKSLP